MSWISAAALQRWNIVLAFMFLTIATSIEHFGRTGSTFPGYNDCQANAAMMLNHDSKIDKLRTVIIFGILSFITGLTALLYLIVPSLQSKNACRMFWCAVTFVFVMISISIYTNDRTAFASCFGNSSENWTFAFQWTSFGLWFFAIVWGWCAREDSVEDCGDCNVYM